MGESTLIEKPEPHLFESQESKARHPSELCVEGFIVRALSQASSDEYLNQKDISLLQRIDRLDNILSAMEDKAPLEPIGHSFRSLNGSRRLSPTRLEKRCKSTESVLEEVEEKGTLIERVSELEKRLTKLEEMIITKTKDNAMLHSIPSYNRSSHNSEHESPQYDVDVEKHEVTPVSSAHFEPPEYEQHNEIPFSPRKEDSYSRHMEDQQGMTPTEGVAMEKEDPRTRLQKAKRREQIRKWLSKQLHKGSSTRQGKHTCSAQSCWNTKREKLHASRHYAHHSRDEDSS